MKRVISFVKGGKGREGRGGASDVVPVRNLSLEGGLDEPPGYEVDTKTLSKLQRAAWLGHLDKLKGRAEQLDAPDKGGRAALHLAAAQGHADVVWFLISNRAKVYEPKGLHSHPPGAHRTLFISAAALVCDFVLLILGRLQKQGARCQKFVSCLSLSVGEGAGQQRLAESRAPLWLMSRKFSATWLAKLRTINFIVASAAVDPIAMFTFYQWRR
jgi:hypothetical protein